MNPHALVEGHSNAPHHRDNGLKDGDQCKLWSLCVPAGFLRRSGWAQAKPGRIQRCETKLGRGICTSIPLHGSAFY